MRNTEKTMPPYHPVCSGRDLAAGERRAFQQFMQRGMEHDCIDRGIMASNTQPSQATNNTSH